MKFYITLIVSTGMFFAGAFPAHAQFGDLLKKAQETIEQVTESPVESVSSGTAPANSEEKTSAVSKVGTSAAGQVMLGTSKFAGSPDDLTHFPIKGFSADMTPDEFISAIEASGGTVIVNTNPYEPDYVSVHSNDLNLTLGGFAISYASYTKRGGGTFPISSTSTRKEGPYSGRTQKISLQYAKDAKPLTQEHEKVVQALDKKFSGARGQAVGGGKTEWVSEYSAADPDTGDVVYLGSSLAASKSGFGLEYQYVEMLPPEEIERDDF